MDDERDLYIWRLEQTGLELTPADAEHDAGTVGAESVSAFMVGDIYLELLVFENQNSHAEVIRMVGEEGWDGGGYWLAASSGGALLLARSHPDATDEDQHTIDALVAAFAGEE